jgi:hypothetical protein
MPTEPHSSYCGTSFEELAAELIETRFVQFHSNGKVVAASLSGTHRHPTLSIAVAVEEPHSHATSIRPLKGTPQSNFDSIRAYLSHAAFM